MSKRKRRPRCRKRGCITLLSRYNCGPRCFLHSAPALASERESRADFIDLLHQLGGYTPWRNA